MNSNNQASMNCTSQHDCKSISNQQNSFFCLFDKHQLEGAGHYTALCFRSIVALHSFRLKLCNIKYIVRCTATYTFVVSIRI